MLIYEPILPIECAFVGCWCMNQPSPNNGNDVWLFASTMSLFFSLEIWVDKWVKLVEIDGSGVKYVEIGIFCWNGLKLIELGWSELT